MSAFMLFLLLAACQTMLATEKWEVNVSAKINGTADQVWPYMADFCNLYKIYPSSVSFCEKGTKGQGLFRYNVIISKSATDPNATVLVAWERHELIEINATQKYVSYDIHENTYGIVLLKPTKMQVVPDGKNGCTFKWNAVSAPIPGFTYEDVVKSQELTLSGIVSSIENLI